MCENEKPRVVRTVGKKGGRADEVPFTDSHCQAVPVNHPMFARSHGNSTGRTSPVTLTLLAPHSLCSPEHAYPPYLLQIDGGRPQRSDGYNLRLT